MKNRAELIGRVGQDPEIRRTQDGRPIANFSLATTEKWKDRDGNPKEHTDWHRVVVFAEGLAKVCEQYVRKGMLIGIEGKIQTREWEDQSGTKRYVTEIVLQGPTAWLQMLGSPGGNRPPPADDPSGRSASGGAATRPPPASSADMDDEIPF
jgi:single-strand DNA-binding protein